MIATVYTYYRYSDITISDDVKITQILNKEL